MTIAPPPIATPVTAHPPAVAAPPVLSVRGLTKRFAEVLAADGLDLDFHRGEIHAVLGENGAGKSTLMKMLYGYYRPDSGEIALEGSPLHLHSPADGRRAGIGMVFQNFTLVPALTVIENIALIDAGRGIRFDRHALGGRIRDLALRYGLATDPSARVADLSVGERQRVEILKLLASDASILILDEPTSVLAPHEVDSLLEILRKLRADGYAIIVITHKMREVFACADRVSVLRRGRIVGAGLIGEYDEHGLLKLMLGDRLETDEAVRSQPGTPAGPGMALSGVTFTGDDGRSSLRNVSLEVRAGELVGVAAVAGNGQAALADVLLGTGKLSAGKVSLGGEDVTRRSPGSRLAAGFRLVPEDPVALGAVGALSVRENMMLSSGPFPGKGRYFLHPARIARTAAALAERAPFPMPAASRVLETLSGGNVQRVVLVRELDESARQVLAYYPSRGLDVASTRAVQEVLIRVRDRGGAVLLVSEDLDELQALCDRVLVFHAGEVVGEFDRTNFDVLRIGRLMTGAEVAW